MKPDISTHDDVKALVDTFYEKVKADPAIGYVFTEVVKTDWPAHLPKMYAFWGFLLIGDAPFQGNPIERHFEVHRMEPLTAEHFDRWLFLFQSTVDELFEGPKAEDAKFRAYSIAATWKPKFTGRLGL